MIPVGNLIVYLFIFIGGIYGIGIKSQSQNPPIEIEIQYYAPDAGEVFLVWGVDGWQVSPEIIIPDGTVIKDKLLYTPLQNKDGYFVATIQIPTDAKLDYGFYITRLKIGRPVSIWDETHLVTSHDIIYGKEIIKIHGELGEIAEKWRLRISDILIPLLQGIGIVFVIIAILHFYKPEIHQKSILIILITILIIGLVIRLLGAAGWNSFHPDNAERLIGDEPGYDNLARELIEGHGFTWPGRVPLYPIWLACIYLFVGGSYPFVPFVQSFLGVLTILLTFLMGSTLFGKKAGLIAAAWSAISYVQIQQGFHFLSEILYTPFLLIAGMAFWKAWRDSTPRNFIIAGFWLGLTNLVKPTLLLFPIFVLFVMLILKRNKQSIRSGLIYLSTSLLVVSPWVIHNFIRYQEFIPLQTSNAILWQGSPEYYHLIRDQEYTYIQVWENVLYKPGWEELDPNSIAGDRYWTQRALRSITSEPLLYLKYAGEKLITFWVGDPEADWDKSFPFNFSALVRSDFLPKDAIQVMIARAIPLIALVAVLVLFRQRKNLLPLLLLIIYFNLVHSLTHAEARLSEPLQPLLLVIISGAVIYTLDKLMTTSLIPSNSSTKTRRFKYLSDLLRELIVRDLKLRYKRSRLGIAWSLLNPLAQLLVLSLIFTRVLPLNIPNYPSFLFIGLLAWNWFQTSLYAATGSIVDNRELINKPGFSAIILPIVTVSSNFIHYLLALPILLGFLLINGIGWNYTILILPVIFSVQFLFTLSLSYIVATMHVTFRDTQYLLGIILMLGFYLSPVFYDTSAIPDRFQLIYHLNPMVVLIDAYRDILLHGQIPSWFGLVILIVVSSGLLWASYRIFKKASYQFAEEL